MQSDWKEIYKLTAKRTGKSEDTYKDIGNFIFQRLSRELKRPKSLIIKLKGVGFWYLRRLRVKMALENFPPDYDKKPEDFKHPLAALMHENKVEIFTLFKERMKDYETYIEERKQIRSTRNESDTLLESDNKED